MRNSALKDSTIGQLIERAAEIGVAQDEAILYDDTSKYNRLYSELDAIDKELRSRGLVARLALLDLYEHPNIQVRLNAAELTLGIAPGPARRLLEAIAARKDVPQGGDAGMSLRYLDNGTYKPT